MEEIDLADLEFAFEEYFERSARGELSTAEEQEYDARVIGLFCRRMLTNPNATGPWGEWEAFSAYYLAKKLRWVLGGVPWRKQFHLPFEWASHQSDMSRTNQRAANIYCAIHNALRIDPSNSVVDLIRQQADEQCVSFETARADYYRIKKSFDAGTGLGPFLDFD